MKSSTFQAAFTAVLTLASYTGAEAVEVGDLVIVTKTTEVKMRDIVVSMANTGSTFKVAKKADGRILVEKEREGGVWELAGWVAESKVEKFTGTVEQKLLMQRTITEDRRESFPGLKLETTLATIWEVPVEIEGKVYFVPFALVKVRGWYESQPDKTFENKYVCAVWKKDTIPSAETLFYEPGLVYDTTIEVKTDNLLKAPRGPIKIPLDD